MDVFDEYLIEIWEVFDQNKVLYIMVEGFEVNMQGFHRTADDFDIYLLDNLTNRKLFRQALFDANIGDYPMMETIQFIPGWTTIQINNRMQLDILTNLKGISASFDECLEMASITQIHHLQIPFLHINHLIQNKLAVNRPQDQIDLFELEKMK